MARFYNESVNHSEFHGCQSSYPPPNLLITLCTMGISLPRTLYTTTSPTCVSWPRFHRNNKSPLWNAGSILPDRTTTMGEEESATTERPFQSMNAVESTRAKLRTWAASCRGCMLASPENMMATARVIERRGRCIRCVRLLRVNGLID